MAINYTNLFTVLGKIVKAADNYEAQIAAFKTNRDAIFDQYSNKNIDYIGSNLSQQVVQAISGMSQGISGMVSQATAVLLDPELVTNHLPTQDRQLSTVLAALWSDMAAESETINAGLTSLGTITGGQGATFGDVLHTFDLSATVSPVGGSAIMPYFSDVGPTLSNLGVPDTLFLRCNNADTPGSEILQLFGSNTVFPYQEQAESFGGSAIIDPTAGSTNLLTDPGFETFASGSFSSWTVNDAGGTLVQETSLVYRGASALRINTLVNADTITISQVLTAPLIRGQRYFFGFRFKSVAAEASGTSSVLVSVSDGTVSSQSTDIALSAPILTSTAWQLVYGTIQCKKTMSSSINPTLTLTMSPTVDGVDGYVIDDIFLVPVTYLNGVGWGFATGSSNIALDDLYQIPVERSASGVFQDFFRKNYGIQLPYDNAGAETIADSLAT